jgi:hypothetical protein
MIDSKFKYIIFEGRTGFDPIIFPPWINHDEMAAKFPNWQPLSAGFIEIKEKDEGGGVQIRCFGESKSLKLKSLPGDEQFFRYLVD